MRAVAQHKKALSRDNMYSLKAYISVIQIGQLLNILYDFDLQGQENPTVLFRHKTLWSNLDVREQIITTLLIIDAQKRAQIQLQNVPIFVVITFLQKLDIFKNNRVISV